MNANWETSFKTPFDMGLPFVSSATSIYNHTMRTPRPDPSPADFTHVLQILESAEEVVGGFEGRLEPTPLGPGGVQELVSDVGLTSTLLNRDALFADVLNPLLDGGKRAPETCSSEQSYKRQRLDEEGSRAETPRRFRRYQSDQWVDRFQELEEFRAKHGNCLVPHCYPENQQLAQWVKRQRYQYKLKQMNRNSTLTDERQAALEEVGFVWDSHRAAWSERYESLLKFVAKYGHTNVPSNYEDKTLAIWIKCQRRQFKLYMRGEKSTINSERIAMMNSLGFIWNPRNL